MSLQQSLVDVKHHIHTDAPSGIVDFQTLSSKLRLIIDEWVEDEYLAEKVGGKLDFIDDLSTNKVLSNKEVLDFFNVINDAITALENYDKKINELHTSDKIIDAISTFINELEVLKLSDSYSKLFDSVSKTRLYANRFSSETRHQKQLDEIPDSTSIINENILRSYYDKLIGINSTIIEGIKLNKSIKIISKYEYDRLILSSEEKYKILEELQNNKKILSDSENENSQLKEKQVSTETAYNVQKEEITRLTNQINQDTREKINLTDQLASIRTEVEAKDAIIISHEDRISQLNVAVQRREIAENSARFQSQADENKRIANYWRLGVIAIISVFVVMLLCNLSSNNDLFDIAKDILKDPSVIDSSLTYNIIFIQVGKKIATKILIYSMVIYLISFFVKNYNAQMHNYIVNSHKANALQSTVDLIGTAKQDDGNDKIILQATQAIFTSQRSGYQGAESEPSSPNLITNFIDAVQPKSK